MSKIVKTDLLNADNSLSLESIQSEITSTNNIIKSINSFIDSSNNILKGNAWNQLKAKLLNYVSLLYEKIDIGLDIIDSIKSANSLMINYMDSYDELDTSMLSELIASRNKYNSNLYELKSILSRNILTDDSVFRMQIASMENIVADLDRIISKLEGLDGIDASAFKGVSSSFNSINSFNSKLSSIKVTPMISNIDI